MDFELNPAQERLRSETAAWAREHLLPSAGEREAAHDIPASVIRSLGDRGLLGINLSKSLGGLELGVVAYAAALREVAYADASVAVTMAVTSMVGEVIAKFGSDEQRSTHNGRLCSGEYFGGAFGLSEPGAGSDAGGLQTRAVRDGSDWVINGEKLWISTGDRAGVTVVWARTGGDGARGISCFLVPKDTPGLQAGKPEEKMGLRASHTVALTLSDVRVPSSALLGKEGEGFKVAMVALDGGRIGIGSQSLGIGTAALDEAVAHSTKRQQWGKALSENQAIQFKLADMAVDLDRSWLLTLRAASLKEAGRPFSREAAMAKVTASEAANRVTREAVQIMGSYGYMERDSRAARLMRDCRVTQIYEGTSEIQRLVIGRSVLDEGRAST